MSAIFDNKVVCLTGADMSAMFDNVTCLRCLDAGGVPRNLHHAQDLQQTEHLLQLLLPGAGGGVGILYVDINTVMNIYNNIIFGELFAF